MVRRTPELDGYMKRQLEVEARRVIDRTHPDIVRRAAAFLLLEDSKASFQIEGERPPHNRRLRWGQAIAEAGRRDLTVDELARLQEMVIGDARFVQLGLRTEGGWIGERDRVTMDPIPTHISARPEDLPGLMQGLVEYAGKAAATPVDPVVACCPVLRFRLHTSVRGREWTPPPLADPSRAGPGGLQSAESGVPRECADAEADRGLQQSSRRLFASGTPPGPVARDEAAQRRRERHRRLLPLLRRDGARRVPLPVCRRDGDPGSPAGSRIPGGIRRVLRRVQEETANMPERTINLLAQFLRQNDGTLSRRARAREFKRLSLDEVERVEELYMRCFPTLPEAQQSPARP